MVRDIPGFYYDLEKKKYFKIQPNHAVPSAANHTQQAVAARKALSTKLQIEAGWSKRLSLGRVATDKLLKRPELSFSLNRSLGYTQRQPARSVGDSVAKYYGATLHRRILFDSTKRRCVVHSFAFDDNGLLLFNTSNGGTGSISSSSIRPYPWPDGALQLHSPTFVAQSATSAVTFASAGESIVWTTSGDFHGARSALIYLRHHGSQHHRFVGKVLPQVDVWDLAASPRNQSVAAATTSGVVVLTNIREHSLDTATNFALPETMMVSYKDENTIIAGERSGSVGLCDLRTQHAIQNRIGHASGVTGLRALSDDNYILVRGSQRGKMSIYDLRYTPLVKKNSATSKTYMDFPAAEQPDRHGLGFDYDPTLNMVATAHSEARLKQNSVSLFSTKTGEAIHSPLSQHRFDSPVTCIRFANMRSGMVDGKIDPSIGPKSIFIASRTVLDVWSPEGFGIESEEQE